MRCTTVVKNKWDRDQNRIGYWTVRLTDTHIFTSNDSSESDSTNHNAMQDTGHYRSQKAGTTRRARSLRHPPLVLVSSGHLYHGAPSQHELKQESRVIVLCSEWPTGRDRDWGDWRFPSCLKRTHGPGRTWPLHVWTWDQCRQAFSPPKTIQKSAFYGKS